MVFNSFETQLNETAQSQSFIIIKIEFKNK